MSKRKIIIFIIIITLITLLVWGYNSISKKTPGEGGAIESGINFVSDFFTFGKSTSTNNGEGTTPEDISGGEQEGTNTTGEVKKRLTRVSSAPVAGYSIFMKERFKYVADVVPGTEPGNTSTPSAPLTETVPAVRYVNRATGNIYQTFADTIREQKFSDTVIPIVYEALFGDNANSVVMRYLKEDNQTISTFIGSLPKEILGGDSVGVNQIKGTFLPENISDMSISPDTSKIFYLLNTKNGVAGMTANSLGDNKVQVFDSAFSEWLSMWPNDNMITLTTKPSYNTPGFMYVVDPLKKDFRKMLSKINGLTTLTSPDGKSILYTNNSLLLNIYSADKNDVSKLTIKTLPEKCVWTKSNSYLYCAVPKIVPNSLYPDNWYQGIVSFSDDIWKIDAVSGVGTKILDPDSFVGENGLDGIKLQVDENEHFLFIVNKKDNMLWELELK